MDCGCEAAVAWWRPAAPVVHTLPFCAVAREAYRAFQDTMPDPDPPFGGRTGVVYDDGRQYRGWALADGATHVPVPPGYGRPNA